MYLMGTYSVLSKMLTTKYICLIGVAASRQLNMDISKSTNKTWYEMWKNQVDN